MSTKVFCKDCRHRTVRSVTEADLDLCDSNPIQGLHPVNGPYTDRAWCYIKNRDCNCAEFGPAVAESPGLVRRILDAL